MAPSPAEVVTPPPGMASRTEFTSAPAAGGAGASAALTRRPVLPPDVSQYFIPVRSGEPRDATLVYHAAVVAAAEVHFRDKKVDASRELIVLASISDGVIAVDWEQAASIDLPISDLEQSPQEAAQFAELPGPAAKVKNYATWAKDFAGWLYRSQKLELLSSPTLKLASNADESERDFRIRLQQAARERRDEAAEKLRQKYAPKIAALEEKRRRAEQTVEREAEQSRGQKVQTAISFGATLLSSFMGRKAISFKTLGRATSAARGVGRSVKEAQDVGRAEETVAAVNQQLADLDAEFKAETAASEQAAESLSEALETITMKPTKANITVKILSLAWAPYWHNTQGETAPAWE